MRAPHHPIDLQQDLDAPVGGIEGVVLDLQLAVGEAGDLGDALLVEAGAHQHVVGRMRARGGEPPVVVGLALERPAVGVPVDGDRALLGAASTLPIFSIASTRSRRGRAEPISNMPKSNSSVTEMVTPLSVATTSSPLPSLSPVPIALAISCLISLAFSIASWSESVLRLRLRRFGSASRLQPLRVSGSVSTSFAERLRFGRSCGLGRFRGLAAASFAQASAVAASVFATRLRLRRARRFSWLHDFAPCRSRQSGIAVCRLASVSTGASTCLVQKSGANGSR